MSWIMSIMHDNTPLPSPKHVSVLAMNFSSHCCVCLNLGQNGHWMSRNHHRMKKIRFLKGSYTLLSRVCFERYGVSNEVFSSYCGIIIKLLVMWWLNVDCIWLLASIFTGECLQWAPSVKLIMYHMAAEELWHLPTHSESCHINIQIFSRLPRQLAGVLGRLNTSPCYLLLFKSFHIFGFINQMTGCY